jgi:16S rRNA (cytidine1402-2'-O)-methyltransferase
MSHRRNGSLFIVATPIGNLKDITIRALETLSSANLIVSENVRKTRRLLRHHDIGNKVMSYREENAKRMVPFLVDLMRAGKTIALVAEAGTPGISDPGRRLVDAVGVAGLKVVPVPGPSAVIAAVSAADMKEQRFAFEGFLPRQRSKRRQRLQDLADDRRQIVIYEAPHRLRQCLVDMKEVFGERTCVVAREITKLHEEIEKGTISAFVAKYSHSKPRGEFVLVCEGARTRVGQVPSDKIQEEAVRLAKQGIRKREIARMLSAKYGSTSRDVYRMIARIKSDRGG